MLIKHIKVSLLIEKSKIFYLELAPLDCNGFRCKNGECIASSNRCDQNVDCSDMSDEEGCDKTDSRDVKVTAYKDNVQLGGQLELECQVSSSNASQFRWQKVSENDAVERMADNVQVNGSKLLIKDIRMENGGLYRCLATTQSGIVHADHVVAIRGS